MGQRHQIYIKAKYSKSTQNNRGVDILNAFHHQWLYGIYAIKMMAKIVKYELNTKSYEYKKEEFGRYDSLHYGGFDIQGISKEKFENFIQSIIELEPENGGINPVINLRKLYKKNVQTKELNEENIEEMDYISPNFQDNDDGQMFIDFSTTHTKPVIGFVFPFNKIKEHNYNAFSIISPEDYMFKFYKEDLENYKKNYSKEEYNEIFKELKETIDFLNENTVLMSQSHLKNIFPNLNVPKKRFSKIKRKTLNKEIFKETNELNLI